MSIGYDKAILRRMEQDPSYSYDMHFKDFARMYKHYSDENFDLAKSIINYGGMSAPQAVQAAAAPAAPADPGFGSFDAPDSGDSGGSGDGTEELLEQADIDALLAQMQ